MRDRLIVLAACMPLPICFIILLAYKIDATQALIYYTLGIGGILTFGIALTYAVIAILRFKL